MPELSRESLAEVLPVAAADPDQQARREGAIPAKRRHAITVYTGKSIPKDFTSIFYAPWEIVFENTYLLALAVSTRLWSLDEHLDIELEASAARRFGDAELWEFAAALFLRWDGFPWNDVVYTTVGLGILGPSFATEISETERNKSGNGKGSKLLNYFAPEITLSPPDNRDFAFIARLHHRSGVFGLFDGVSGGSNFLALGVRYRF